MYTHLIFLFAALGRPQKGKISFVRGEDMKKILVLAVVATLLVASCAGMTTTEQRVLSGGAVGAGGGALVGWAAGNPAVGAAVGAGAGAVGGLLYDQYEKSQGRP